MAGLLPYLGHQTLYNRINFEASWRDEENWLAAHTLVPHFLDPTYPITSHYTAYPGMPLGVATTHYVGIAGVGIDVADADLNDPAYKGKLGMFGYDRMMPLDRVNKGRGLSNTVLMIRVPHDVLPGPTPWMAGGGSTVRNVPDKNSLEPFLSTDAKGDRYTYAVMADGSVRKIMKGMKDELFKMICTVDGPSPDDLDEFAKVDPVPKREPEWKPTGKVDPPRYGTNTSQPPPDKGKGGKPGKEGGGIKPKEGGGIKPKEEGKPVVDPPSGGNLTGWKVFESAEGGFSIMLPEKSFPFDEYVNEAGPSTKMKGFNLQASPTVIVRVGFMVLPDQAVQKSDLIYKNFKDSLTRQGGNLVGDTEVDMAGTKAKEWQLDKGAGQPVIFVRVFLVQNRLYYLNIGGPGLSTASEEYKTFFNSFKLTR
jgi:hypothetical protein